MDPLPAATSVPSDTTAASAKSGETEYSTENDGSDEDGQPHDSTVHISTASPAVPLSAGRMETAGSIDAGGSAPKKRTASTAAFVAISAAESDRS